MKELWENFKNQPNIIKLLVCVGILLLMIIILKPNYLQREGYVQNNKFLFKQGPEVYDDFYADIYDYLVFNDVKNNYEVGQIVNQVQPNSKSVILDIGSGTGHHVAALASQNLDVVGIDISPSMVARAKKNYPNYKYKVADALDGTSFPSGSFTQILCLYFTLYYMQNKQQFFNNAYDWLMPGGSLIVHLVDQHNFDPIVPPANPLYAVSPQKYAKNRITKSKVTFDEFIYTANFVLPPGQSNATFEEKFKFPDGKTRKQEHTLYMESIEDIANYAKSAGFIVKGQIDLTKCAYEYQYLYIFDKPASF